MIINDESFQSVFIYYQKCSLHIEMMVLLSSRFIKKEIRKINVEELNKTDGYVCRLLLSTRIRYLGKGY